MVGKEVSPLLQIEQGLGLLKGKELVRELIPHSRINHQLNSQKGGKQGHLIIK